MVMGVMGAACRRRARDEVRPCLVGGAVGWGAVVVCWEPLAWLVALPEGRFWLT